MLNIRKSGSPQIDMTVKTIRERQNNASIQKTKICNK